ncbi:MAG: CopD family protein [Alphaproteobacteria bacterium]|jgi:putative membrane protein|tara:strand:- start:847 stop:1278 length:432 start_codon:yes stop_codon:yes gene_type:complete
MEYYLTVKSIHMVAIVSWFAGLFYLPRLFVYHSNKNIELTTSKIFKVMEYKLHYYIMYPAMIVALLTGLYLKIFVIGWSFPLWFSVKFHCVILLVLYHFLLTKHLNDFKKNKNKFSEKYFRFINEIPTVLLIIIVASAYHKYY